MATLSACLIAKNEEHFIGNCLKSLLGVVDEIIVVDTGSTDRTKEIATSYGAKIIESIWEDDFAKARNLSLRHATKDWIIVMDCDELLPYEDGQTLKQTLANNPTCEAFHLNLHNWRDDAIISSAIVLRIFRNRNIFKFKGKIHEQIGPSIVKFYGKGSIVFLPIGIYHFGYDNNFTSQQLKSDRNLNLLLATEEHLKNGYYYYSLGNEYVRLGKYVEAIDCYTKALSLSKGETPTPSYCAYAVMHLCLTYFEVKDFYKVIELCTLYEPLLPNFKDLYLLKAFTLKEMCRYADGFDALTSYDNCNQPDVSYPSNQLRFINQAQLRETLTVNNIRPCVYTAYIVQQDHPSLLAGIKNLATLSYKQFAFIERSKKEHFQQLIATLEHFGVQIFYVPSFEDGDMLKIIYETVKNQWLFLLNANELIPFPVVKLVDTFLKTASETHYTLNLYNISTELSSQGLRLIHVTSEEALKSLPSQLGSSFLTVYQNFIP